MDTSVSFEIGCHLVWERTYSSHSPKGIGESWGNAPRSTPWGAVPIVASRGHTGPYAPESLSQDEALRKTVSLLRAPGMLARGLRLLRETGPATV